MKKVVVTVALFAVLGTLAVSCQKETLTELSPVAAQAETYLLTYSVDGISMQTQLNGDEELRAFLRRLTALARQGHRVTVRNANALSQSFSKERVEYRTKSEDDANEWAQKMIKDGYEVAIDYDDETGEFVCVAIK
ncbi:MAG: hypothetical protein IKN51_01685 [Bacteroidaceae bacterium]|nr:hypothetical protein [Bacteroidaceae bacterium]